MTRFPPIPSRFLHADGRRNQAAIDRALAARIGHWAEFNRHVPGLVSSEEWARDVAEALAVEIQIEERRLNRRKGEPDGRPHHVTA